MPWAMAAAAMATIYSDPEFVAQQQRERDEFRRTFVGPACPPAVRQAIEEERIAAINRLVQEETARLQRKALMDMQNVWFINNTISARALQNTAYIQPPVQQEAHEVAEALADFDQDMARARRLMDPRLRRMPWLSALVRAMLGGSR